MSRDDARYDAPRRGHPKRHDPHAAMQDAIGRAHLDVRGPNVTLRFGNGTFISYTPMPEQYMEMVNRKLTRRR